MYGSGWKPYQNLEYTNYWSNFPTKRCRPLFLSTTPNDWYVQHEKSVSPTSQESVFRIAPKLREFTQKLLKVPPFQPRNSEKNFDVFPLDCVYVHPYQQFFCKSSPLSVISLMCPSHSSQVERQRLEESNLSLGSSRGSLFEELFVGQKSRRVLWS